MPTSSKHSPCVGIRTCSDYSPFGVELDGRTVSGGYRFGFQGSEKDNEFKGDGNSYTTEFRQLDPRLGRWLSVDPLFEKYSWQSPYCAFNNCSILLCDPLGLEAEGGPGDEEGIKDRGTTTRENLANGKSLGVDSFGKSWYMGIDESGKSIYTYTQNGIVKGAGYTTMTTEQMILKYGLK